VGLQGWENSKSEARIANQTRVTEIRNDLPLRPWRTWRLDFIRPRRKPADITQIPQFGAECYLL
jgi:hypothetical protein